MKTELPTRGVVTRTPLRVGDVVGGAAERLVPAGGELLAQAGAQGEVRAQLDGVLDIPRAEQASPAEFVGRGHHLEAADRALQERGQAGEVAWPSWREAVSSLSCMRWNHTPALI